MDCKEARITFIKDRIGFEPEKSIAVNCNLHRGDPSIAIDEYKTNLKNYYFNYK
jgi:hypothetical protein